MIGVWLTFLISYFGVTIFNTSTTTLTHLTTYSDNVGSGGKYARVSSVSTETTLFSFSVCRSFISQWCQNFIRRPSQRPSFFLKVVWI